MHRLSTIGLVAILSACAPESDIRAAREAVNGTVDSDPIFPGVLGMVIEKRPGRHTRCTGTLIERNLLLTARHCVSPTESVVICESAPLGTPVSPDLIVATPDVTPMGDITRYTFALRVEVPPDGNDECGFDIAAVILRDEVAVEPYEPRLDTPVITGEEYTAVGYGTTGSGGLGTRRYLDGERVSCIGGEDCTFSEVRAREWIGEDGGFCSSDSGAAALDLDGRLIGVVSKGVNPCDFPIASSVPAWADWIRSVGQMAAAEGGYAPPAWAVATTVDAGVGAPDAGPVVDAGMPPDAAANDGSMGPPMSSDGGCAAAPAAPQSRWPLWSLLLVFLATRRQRSTCRQP